MIVRQVGDRRMAVKLNHYGGGPVTLLTHSAGTVLKPRVTYQSDKGGSNWAWDLSPKGDLVESLGAGFYYFRFKGYTPDGVPPAPERAA